MPWEAIFVFAVLIGALVSFIWEKVSPDVTALASFGLIALVAIVSGSERLPGMETLFDVFSNPAPITIAGMFILSAALEQTGAIDKLAAVFMRLKSANYAVIILAMALLVGGMSAFINNTPVVVVLLPMILTLARHLGIPASKLLIPLSYVSIMGGTCTLIGTSTNILASGILADRGLPALGMFEMGMVGLPILGCGVLYLMFFGNRLLPHRENLTSILSEEERREYITEAFVKADSAAVGQTLKECGLTHAKGVRTLEIVRHGVAVPGEIEAVPLQAGDRLVLACRPHGVARAREIRGVDLGAERGLGVEQIATEAGMIVEGVIGPNSWLAGRRIREVNFRQRYRMVIVAVHRHGRNVREQLGNLTLQFGDTLLMMGTEEAIENLRRGKDILLLDEGRVSARAQGRKLPIALGVAAGVIVSASFNLLPIELAVLLGAVVLFLTKTLRPKDAYASIDWSILLLIFGMLGIGVAMESSGAVGVIANGLVSLGQDVPPSLRNMVLLALLYLTTSILTETLSNNATVVIMVPLGIGLAESLGVDSRPFVIAATLAASASFATPIGYQTNTYVYGAGNYRFADFLKAGLSMNLLYFLISMLLIPRIWPF